MKYLVYLTVAGLIIGLALSAIILKNQLIDAQNYIKRLESDFPEYVDTTSGTDEYSDYYRWH